MIHDQCPLPVYFSQIEVNLILSPDLLLVYSIGVDSIHDGPQVAGYGLPAGSMHLKLRLHRRLGDTFLKYGKVSKVYEPPRIRSVIGIQGLESKSIKKSDSFRFRFLPMYIEGRIIAFRFKSVSDATLF